MHLSTTMVPSTSNLVVKDVAEVVAASLVMVLVVAVMVEHQAVAVHLVVDNLGSSLDTLDILGNSLDLVAILVARRLGNSLDTLVAVLVVTSSHLDRGLDTLVIVEVPGGVALEEVALPLDKSSATGVARQATSLPIVRRLW